MNRVKFTILHNDYKKLRNEITKDKHDSKKVYFTAYFERNKNKSATIWKGIKSFVNTKPAKSPNIKLLDENNNIASYPKKLLICLTIISPLLAPKLNKITKLIISMNILTVQMQRENDLLTLQIILFFYLQLSLWRWRKSLMVWI